MPLYEYACKACGQHLEVAQSFKDEPLTTCPACGGPLRKVFGSIGISFKGSGFYRTDSRTPTGKPAGKGEKDKGEKDKGEKDKVEKGKVTSEAGGKTSSGSGSGDGSASGSGSGSGEKTTSGSSDGTAATSAAKTA